MKKLKMNLVLVAALAIGAVTMSFKMANNTALVGEKWFEYTDETGDGNINNPANYELANGDGENLPPCPNGEEERCAVKAMPQTGDTDHPDLGTIVSTKLRKQQ